MRVNIKCDGGVGFCFETVFRVEFDLIKYLILTEGKRVIYIQICCLFNLAFHYNWVSIFFLIVGCFRKYIFGIATVLLWMVFFSLWRSNKCGIYAILSPFQNICLRFWSCEEKRLNIELLMKVILVVMGWIPWLLLGMVWRKLLWVRKL